MTAEDALNKYDKSMNDNQIRIGRAQVIMAIKEFGAHMYNQAIDDAAKYAISQSENHPRLGWCTTVNKQSI